MLASLRISTIINWIDQAIRFLICLMIFWIPYSKAVIETSVIAAFVLLLAKKFLIFVQFRQEHGVNRLEDFLRAFSFKYSVLNPAIAVFVAICALSLVFSLMPERSVTGFFNKTLEWFAVYFLVLEVFNKPKYIYIAVGIFLFTSVATCFDALFQYYSNGPDLFNQRKLVDGYRATGGFIHPNKLGAYLTMVIPLTLSLLFFRPLSWKLRIGVIMMVALMVWALLLTFSRGAWLGTLIGVAAVVGSVFGYRARLVRNWSFLVAAGLFIFAFVFQGLQWREHSNVLANDTETIEWRIFLWKESVKMFAERPWFGHGLNTYMPLMDSFLKKSDSSWAIHYSASYAHNCYLQVGVEVGILGLIAFLTIFIVFFKEVWRRYDPRQKNARAHTLKLGILGGLLGFLAHSFVDTNFYTLQLPALFWCFTALAISLDRLLRQEEKCVIT